MERAKVVPLQRCLLYHQLDERMLYYVLLFNEYNCEDCYDGMILSGS